MSGTHVSQLRGLAFRTTKPSCTACACAASGSSSMGPSLGLDRASLAAREWSRKSRPGKGFAPLSQARTAPQPLSRSADNHGREARDGPGATHPVQGGAMKFKSAILAVALVAGSAVGASANGTFCFGPMAGASLPMGDYGDAASTGWNAGGTCSYNMTSGWGVGADLGYHSWSGSDELNQAAELAFGTGSEIKWTAIQITPNVSYHFPTAGSVKPYAKFGVGMYDVKAKLSSPSGDSDASKSKMGFNFGGGMDFSSHGNMTWGVDTAYHIISASDDFGTDINNVTFGLHMTFGAG